MKNRLGSAACWLLVIPYIGLVWVPFYNVEEPALFGFGSLTLLTALTLSFDPHNLWDVADARCGRWRKNRERRRVNARRAANQGVARSLSGPPTP